MALKQNPVGLHKWLIYVYNQMHYEKQLFSTRQVTSEPVQGNSTYTNMFQFSNEYIMIYCIKSLGQVQENTNWKFFVFDSISSFI